MTVADLNLIDIGLSDEKTYDALNDLFVGYEDFSKISNLYSRAYGVINDAQGGLTTDDRADNDRYRQAPLNSFVLNDCLRNAIWDTLYSVQAETEGWLGFNLTERYHEEEITWPRSGKVQLTWPGIESLEVERNWYEIEGFGLQSLDYFVETNVVVIEDPEDATKQAVVIDGEFVQNPNDAIIRKDSNNQIIEIDTTKSPVWTGSDWRIRINHIKSATSVDDLVNVQHRRIIYLDINVPDTSELPTGGDILPVYPDTNQVIPQARTYQDIGGGQRRYYFYAYTLVNPAFRFENIFWNRGEFYKMYEAIEFKYRVEESAYIELVWTDGDDQVVYQYDPNNAADQPHLSLQIAVQKSSIIHLYVNDQLGCTLGHLQKFWKVACGDDCVRDKMPETATIRIKYKTSPSKLSSTYRNQIGGMKKAISGKVAADLPTEDCGCEVEIGFIATNQRIYGSRITNNVTGITVERVKYGQRQGQVHWTETLQNATIYRRILSLGTVV